MLKLCVLASGSNGNAIVIYTQSTSILLDAGISAKRICDGLASIGLDARKLDGIFITHTHSDHISGLRVFLNRTNAPIYTTKASGEELSALVDRAASRLRFIYPDEPCCIGDLKICAFRSSHDTSGSVGFSVSSQGRKCAVITDLGVVTDTVRSGVFGAQMALVEANHDIDWLRSGPYSQQLQARVSGASGHLSNEACGAFCCELAEHGAEQFLLGHLSGQNNAPEHALRVVQNILRHHGHLQSVHVVPRGTICGPYEV